MSTQFFDAIQAGDLAAVQSHLAGGADCNARQEDDITPLMLAAHLGHRDIVKTLILRGADVNAKNAYGWTALMKALYNYDLNRGFPEIVHDLIDAGSEIETQIAYGTRPLMLAAGYGQAEVVDELLGAGADVFARNEGGFTARTMAEYKDYVQVINQLYDAELSSGNLAGACSTQGAGGASVIRFAQKP